MSSLDTQEYYWNILEEMICNVDTHDTRDIIYQVFTTIEHFNRYYIRSPFRDSMETRIYNYLKNDIEHSEPVSKITCYTTDNSDMVVINTTITCGLVYKFTIFVIYPKIKIEVFDDDEIIMTRLYYSDMSIRIDDEESDGEDNDTDEENQ